MDALFADFVEAQNNELGYLLASTISPEPTKHDPARLYNFVQAGNAATISTDLKYKLQYNPGLSLTKDESKLWLEIFTLFWKFAAQLIAAEDAQRKNDLAAAHWNEVYMSWQAVVNALLRGYSSSDLEAWTIPCLYTAGKYLRVFAIKADDAASALRDSGAIMTNLVEDDAAENSSQHATLENAARTINRIFGICNGDRNPIEDSRKWALYYIASLLFKTYFRLGSLNLCMNILKSLKSSGDLPDLSRFPKPHQVTFKYYAGVIYFLEEDYVQAEQYLDEAFKTCNVHARRNTELILTYLIPTKLITKHQVPKPALLAPYPRLQKLFMPIITAIRHSNLTALQDALIQGEDEFVKRRVFLTLERAQDVAVRNLFMKIYVAGGYDPLKEGETTAVRRTRIPLAEFSAALLLAGAEVQDGEGGVDTDEVECVIANMMYKGMMKGYIARDRGFVVLSKSGAFPTTPY